MDGRTPKYKVPVIYMGSRVTCPSLNKHLLHVHCVDKFFYLVLLCTAIEELSKGVLNIRTALTFISSDRSKF